jgi:hypothetical protein
MQSLWQDGTRKSGVVRLLRFPLAIPAKSGNDCGSKKVHPFLCCHDLALHPPDPVVAALIQMKFNHERHETHEKNL